MVGEPGRATEHQERDGEGEEGRESTKEQGKGGWLWPLSTSKLHLSCLGDTEQLFHAQSMEKGWISQRKLNLCSANCLTCLLGMQEKVDPALFQDRTLKPELLQ